MLGLQDQTRREVRQAAGGKRLLRFAGSALNACFVSGAEHLIDGRRAGLWIHGHTHDSFDYVVNGARVLCNPRGYAKDGVNENALFDANLTVEVG